MIDFAEGTTGNKVKIRVIGIGGGGGNAINNMIDSKLREVGFVAANTDSQALSHNKAPLKIQLGPQLTKGLGAGADPEVGKKAALEDKDRIREVIGDAQMVFITAGMGGGTGTGAAPVIAQVARDLGALTVGVVTKPFFFEGFKRKIQAEKGIGELTGSVDSLITIPNQKLVGLTEKKTALVEAFRMADDVLLHAVKSISDLVTQNGLVNLDFADVEAVMRGQGQALMGTGFGEGEGRAKIAAEQAIASPLLDDISINGAKGVLVNVIGGPDLGLHEIEEAVMLIHDAAHEESNIIFGAVIDERVGQKVMLTVIATGIEVRQKPQKTAKVSRRLGSFGQGEERTRVKVPVGKTPPTPVAESVKAPATLRQAMNVGPAEWGSGQPQAGVINGGDQLDIPTFMRRPGEALKV